MTENKEGKTDFIDTLIEAYNSLDQNGKGRLNEIAMSIYATMKNRKDKDNNEVKENIPNEVKNEDEKKVLSGFFDSLKSLSKVDK